MEWENGLVQHDVPFQWEELSPSRVVSRILRAALFQLQNLEVQNLTGACGTGMNQTDVPGANLQKQWTLHPHAYFLLLGLEK